MSSLTRAAVPAHLLLCMLLGGSGQGVWFNAVLQLVGIVLIAWAVVTRRRQALARESLFLFALAAGAVLLVLLQLVPLPSELWPSLPGREPVSSGYESLGLAAPPLPLSLTPYDTLSAAYALLPPLAVLAGALCLHAHRERWIVGAIVLGALASVLLSAIQLSGDGVRSWAYLYPYTNTGAVGFFANRNHMADLLVIAIPFAVALLTSGQRRARGKGFATFVLGGVGLLLLGVGLVLNASLAALGLALPVLAFTSLLLPVPASLRRFLVPAGTIALIAVVVALAGSSAGADLRRGGDLASLQSRADIWETTTSAIESSFPIGTGVGSFPAVYAAHEDQAAVGNTYVNHAHNDYLELVLETGLPGLLLMLAFLTWWGIRVFRVWKSPSSSHFAKAATIASAAVLAHSIVDYPLRTAAIASVFAACLALMLMAPRQRESGQARHVVIG